MSKRDWGTIFKGRFGLTSTLFFAGLLIVGLAWPAWLVVHEIDQRAARNASNYAEYAQDQILRECRSMSPQAAADCARKINDAARAEQRSEYDLAAQESVAVWTAVMGGVAVLGVSLSLVGVFLIWQTWAETRRAAESSAKTYRAFVAVEEANLVVDAHNGMLVEGTEPHWSFYVKVYNLGRAPAILHTVKIGDKVEFLELVLKDGAEVPIGTWDIPFRESPRSFDVEINYSSGAHYMACRKALLVITDRGSKERPGFTVFHRGVEYRD